MNTPKIQTVSISDSVDNKDIIDHLNLEQILLEANHLGSKDIHIEPRDKYASIRFRIDGLLKEHLRLNKKLISKLIKELESESSTDLKDRKVPYDTQFNYLISDTEYKIEASVLPTINGQKIFLKIMSLDTTLLSLKELGLWGDNLNKINRAIVQTKGLVIVSGPNGSGKTTTLYSILSLLNSPAINISTLEQRIEQRIEGINQTIGLTDKSSSYIKTFEAIRNQDPNIVMIDELKDRKISYEAIDASLNSCLVVGGIHTDNAISVIKRFEHMGIETYLIASSLNIIIAQRLLRRLCDNCRESYEPSSELLSSLFKNLKYISLNNLSYLHSLEIKAKKSGIEPADDLNTSQNSIKRLWRANSSGCSQCNYSGYRGRIGIFEVLVNTDSLEKVIVGQTSSQIIEAQAINDGYIPMEIDGLIKAVRGITTIDEVVRVT